MNATTPAPAPTYIQYCQRHAEWLKRCDAAQRALSDLFMMQSEFEPMRASEYLAQLLSPDQRLYLDRIMSLDLEGMGDTIRSAELRAPLSTARIDYALPDPELEASLDELLGL